ncbi:MAG: hypothetical protein ACM3N9_01435 [Syntrophothermus sp.]
MEEEKITDAMEESYPAEPQKMPENTYWPFVAGFGMFFLLWGILTSWSVSVIGLLLMIIAFTGWIADVDHDYGEQGGER